ncbi:MAG: hypothetical protein ACI4UE_06015 [Candidatus Scatovivens sp.]
MFKIVKIRDNSLYIIEEVKKLFSSKTVEKEIFLDDIRSVQKEETNGKMRSITILVGDDESEEFIDADETENIEEILEFLKSKKDSKNYEMHSFDIDTCETKKI